MYITPVSGRGGCNREECVTSYPPQAEKNRPELIFSRSARREKTVAVPMSTMSDYLDCVSEEGNPKDKISPTTMYVYTTYLSASSLDVITLCDPFCAA